MMIKAIIVEDEAPLRELLRLHISEVDPDISILAECSNIQMAEEAIHALQPDLIFLDIILPGGTGFDLLQRVAPLKAEVIFITAYDSYTLEAFRRSAIGYVLKPVETEELRTAITNARKRIQSAPGISDLEKIIDSIKSRSQSHEKIALPTQDGFLFVKTSEIIRCESDKVYTWIYLESGKKMLCSYNIGEFRKILPEDVFFQCHKSHIISLKQLKSYNGKDNTVELLDGSVIPVSRRNKSSFLNNFRFISRNLD